MPEHMCMASKNLPPCIAPVQPNLMDCGASQSYQAMVPMRKVVTINDEIDDMMGSKLESIIAIVKTVVNSDQQNNPLWSATSRKP